MKKLMKNGKLMLMMVALIALQQLAGCAPINAGASASRDKAIVPDLPPYNGPKARVAIAEFKWDVGSSGGGVTFTGPDGTYTWGVTQTSDYMNGLDDMLTTALMKSRRFQVLENDLGSMKGEIDLAGSGYVDQSAAAEKGGWKGADILIYASVTEWDPEASKKSAGLGGLVGGALGGVKVGKKVAKMAMHIRLVDVRNRITLVSEGVRGNASSWNLGLGGGGVMGGIGLLGGLSEYEKTPMGEAITVCVAEAVKLVAEEAPNEYFKF